MAVLKEFQEFAVKGNVVDMAVRGSGARAACAGGSRAVPGRRGAATPADLEETASPAAALWNLPSRLFGLARGR
jgi:hypothetical protein